MARAEPAPPLLGLDPGAQQMCCVNSVRGLPTICQSVSASSLNPNSSNMTELIKMMFSRSSSPLLCPELCSGCFLQAEIPLDPSTKDLPTKEKESKLEAQNCQDFPGQEPAIDESFLGLIR